MSGALREGPKVGSNRTVEAEVLLRSVRSRLLSFVQPLVYSAGSLRQRRELDPGTGSVAAWDSPPRWRRGCFRGGNRRGGRGAQTRTGISMTLAERDWGDGYITDIAYLPGYFRQQSRPSQSCLPLGWRCRNRFKPSPPTLGSGYGFSALTLAAANPHWRVTGIDFSPAHVAAALALAAEAGIANVHFIEADLAALAAGELAPDIPESDVVAAHGRWSWVGDPARAGIVRLLGSRLRPGRLLYICYNAMAARSSALGMQRLVRDAGSRARKAKRQASRCRARYRPHPRGCKCAAAARPLRMIGAREKPAVPPRLSRTRIHECRAASDVPR
jgi:SAM-dependent methyltransferase